MLSRQVTLLTAESGSSFPPPIVGLVVSLGILGFILYRQRQVRPLKTTPVLPIVLVILGLGSLIGASQGQPMTPSDIGVLIALLVGDAIAFGALRAYTVRLWRDGEVVVQQGSWLTVALWLAGLAIHEAVVAAAHVTSASLLLYLGLTLGTQRLVVGTRARRPGQVAGAPPAPAGRQPRRTPPASRFGSVLRWLRWPVLIAWVLAIVVLHPLASGLSAVTSDSASAYLPPSAQSTQVAKVLQAAQRGPGQPESDQAIVIFARPSGLTAADVAAVSAARLVVGQLAGRTGEAPGLGAPGPLQRSSDGQAAVFAATVTAPQHSLTSADTTAVTAIRNTVEGPASHDGLQVAVTGQAAVTADSGSGTQTGLLLTALVIVALILLLVYRSPVLWLLPLLGAVGAIVVAQAGAHGLASAGLTVSSLSTAILIVLVFGAASDYALLLTHRYREELRRHAAAEDAMAAALRRTLPALVASAATVTGAMLCLLAAESASLHGLGPVGAVAIVSALLAQTTFLPALLLAVGRGAFWPRVPRPGDAGREESGLWAGVGGRVARYPARVTLCAVLVLCAACAGLFALRTDNNPLSDLKGHPGSVAGAQLLAAHFPAGTVAPLVLLTPPPRASSAAAAAADTPGVAAVSPGTTVGGDAEYSVTMSVPPYSAQGAAVIVQLRQRLGRDAPGSLVGGEPAVYYDIAQAAGRDTLVLVPLILAVILVVVALLLQAVVAPLVLVATTALSFAASFGLANLLWRYGLGYSGIQSQLPLYIFIFLVALGVDYNIFLSARVREEARHLGIRQGTLRALGVTGGVITAAGLVLAGSFAALAQLPSVSLTEVGTAVAIGVLLDTLLVRTVLVPASLLTIGERAWWPARHETRRGVEAKKRVRSG
jgi:putative drug exporter of the RND superfamily